MAPDPRIENHPCRGWRPRPATADMPDRSRSISRESVFPRGRLPGRGVVSQGAFAGAVLLLPQLCGGHVVIWSAPWEVSKIAGASEQKICSSGAGLELVVLGMEWEGGKVGSTHGTGKSKQEMHGVSRQRMSMRLSPMDPETAWSLDDRFCVLSNPLAGLSNDGFSGEATQDRGQRDWLDVATSAKCRKEGPEGRHWRQGRAVCERDNKEPPNGRQADRSGGQEQARAKGVGIPFSSLCMAG
ncbi:uncharacterized protein J3D65DRAFT_262055 [Phyllosticta citribraziliensis]|uniref:Uncharacterized protein n=1 Tax=Phyllosticta citribraziliensis TaxID=989973 RepID=A0ABR1M2H5_9PEZI